MKRTSFFFSLVLAFIIASTTYAAPPVNTAIKNLKGKYFVIGTRSCVQATEGGGFGAPPEYQLNSTGSTRVYQVTGELELFANGTGFVDVKQLAIYNIDLSLPGRRPMSSYTGTCDVIYSSNPDGSLAFTFWNCNGELTAGFQTGYLAGQSDFTEPARLSEDGGTLLFSIVEPRVETTWVEDPASHVRTEYNRICSRIATGVKLK
jgi:hypothetical protein